MPPEFNELINLHDEKNGGTEEFFCIDAVTIGCRYGDCCITRAEDGWRYGTNRPAYETPSEAYAQRRSDAQNPNPPTP